MRFLSMVFACSMLCASGCAGKPTRQGETTMPSPEGCFVQVWDLPGFKGVTDYINGPRSYSNLRDLPGARIWADRIRSTKTGVVARAIVYAREDFQGASLRLMPDSDYATFPNEMSGHIASIRIECASPAKVP